MVVREDGTKWACQSCLKGHRVSGCTHTDRELTLVPKKGRPVTQCQHCRQERKKRSAHVKCDCSEVEKPHHPKEKCIHLREAEERAKAGFLDDHQNKEEDPQHLAAVAEEQGCCCHHGGKCTCTIVKKESQAKDGTTPHGPAVHKPRLETTKSDGQITVFANGHHKPVHKRNHAAHECGMPYKMPIPRAQTEQNITTTARRSVDSLALDSNMSWTNNQQALPPLNTEGIMSRSEQPSPRHNAMTDCNGGLSDTKLSTFDFSNLVPVQTNQSVDSAVTDASIFPPLDPMSAMTDAGFDPWSTYPSADSSMPNNNPFSAWATSFDTTNGVQPALTAASSGTQSEIDELPTMDDLYGFSMPSIREDGLPYGQDEVPGDNSNANRRSLPPNFFGNADFSMPTMPNEWQTPVGSLHGSDPDKSKPGTTDSTMGGSDPWNTPTMPSMSSIAQRPATITSNSGRPQSHSVGPSSAPSDDLIRQLFPDIDINNGMFFAGTSPAPMELKRLGGLPVSPSSNTGDLGPMDETMGLTSQPWTDGSLSVPADAFSNPYNLEPDFSSQNYPGNWPYQ